MLARLDLFPSINPKGVEHVEQVSPGFCLGIFSS